jgi:hypothetical protein
MNNNEVLKNVIHVKLLNPKNYFIYVNTVRDVI